MHYNSLLNKGLKISKKTHDKKSNSFKYILVISCMALLLTAIVAYAMDFQANKSGHPESTTQIIPLSVPDKTPALAVTTLETDDENQEPVLLASITAKHKVSKFDSAIDTQTVEYSTDGLQTGLKSSVQDKTLPPVNTNLPVANKGSEPLKLITVKVKSGDTLSGIFKRLSLSASTLHKIIHSGNKAKQLTRIKPGQTFMIAVDDNNHLRSIRYQLDKITTLVIRMTDSDISIGEEQKTVTINPKFASGTIDSSLFLAAGKSGLSDSMTMKLAHLFGWDIDFALSIRKGDQFALIYEEKFVDGKKIADGDIVSAEFINQGKVFHAVRYTDASGHTDYYSPEGFNMRKAFLRTPVEFSRISSHFSKGRKHPVLNRIRAHKGVDYAAPRGTPIKAAGDGKVIFKGRKGGYGKVVILKHGSKYTTLYAHLSSFNRKIKNGKHVKQGQVIGYVGSSGLATGPHLHYEFRVNGVHRNPLTVPLPKIEPLAKEYRADFKKSSETLLSQLKASKQSTVALAED